MLLRTRIPELMDDPHLDRALQVEALDGLELLNKLSGSAQILWSELRRLKPSIEGGKISVLDIATGSGDILISLSQMARKSQTTFGFVGLDISETAVLHAAEKAARRGCASEIRFARLDVVDNDIPRGFDVAISSLFTHHLDEEQVVSILQKMRASDVRMILINDLVRSRMAYNIVWLATRVCTRSPVVHFDGPVSVRAAFTPEEMKNMALQAGLDGCTVKLYPPLRQLLVWRRP